MRWPKGPPHFHFVQRKMEVDDLFFRDLRAAVNPKFLSNKKRLKSVLDMVNNIRKRKHL